MRAAAMSDRGDVFGGKVSRKSVGTHRVIVFSTREITLHLRFSTTVQITPPHIRVGVSYSSWFAFLCTVCVSTCDDDVCCCFVVILGMSKTSCKCTLGRFSCLFCLISQSLWCYIYEHKIVCVPNSLFLSLWTAVNAVLQVLLPRFVQESSVKHV